MRNCHLKKSKQTSLKNDPYKSPAKPQEIRAGEQSPPCNSRVAGLLPNSEVIQRVKIAENPVKRAFHGVLSPSLHSPCPRNGGFALRDSSRSVRMELAQHVKEAKVWIHRQKSPCLEKFVAELPRK